MRVILLEKVGKLGFIGDVVDVKRGFARNWLLPKSKALRATSANLEYFEAKKVELEAANDQKKADAEAMSSKMQEVSLLLIRPANETGILYGAIKSHDVCVALAEQGYSISKSQVKIDPPIKTLGEHKVSIILHPEVSLEINLKIITAQEVTNIEPIEKPHE